MATNRSTFILGIKSEMHYHVFHHRRPLPINGVLHSSERQMSQSHDIQFTVSDRVFHLTSRVLASVPRMVGCTHARTRGALQEEHRSRNKNSMLTISCYVLQN